MFSASPPEDWGLLIRERLKAHIKRLELQTLFASNAGSHFCTLRRHLSALFKKGGKYEIRSYMREQLKYLEAVQLNTWKTAMYRAIIENDSFCNGGFMEE